MDSIVYKRERDYLVFGVVGVCAMTREEFVSEVFSLPTCPVSATVNLVGVPAVISAKEDSNIAEVFNNSSLAAIDGMPIVRISQRRGFKCERCAAPDIMSPVFAESVKHGKTHYFYGGKDDEVLRKLSNNLVQDYPGIQIVGMYSPPFHPPTDEEDQKICDEINELHPDFLWVGIGAPKQEIWMSQHRDKIYNTVMLGVGAGFNYLAGTLDKAPEWMEKASLEWLFRLIKEPKRLWRRYVIGGLKFLYYSLETKVRGKEVVNGCKNNIGTLRLAKNMRIATVAKKPRILMIGPGRNVKGGISTVVNTYFNLGLDHKVDLTYLSTMEDGSKFKKLMKAFLAYVRFCQVLKQYDIVHIHMAAQASFSRKALFVKKAHQAGKKIIIHQHAADFDDFFFKQSDDANRKRIKSVFALADNVIVLSKEWAEFYGKHVCDSHNVIVLHNGVIMPEYEKADYENHNILFLGRLGNRKGIYDLLEAIPEVIIKVPDAMFYLGGDGDVVQCQAIANEKGFSDHVQLLGWVCEEERKIYLEKCSIFILPSYHEGMPMAVLEAMSYGLATISTNVGGISQIIDNDVNGIRVEAGDIAAITYKMIQLLQDIHLKENLGRAGKEKIRLHFCAAPNVAFLTKLYCEFVRVM